MTRLVQTNCFGQGNFSLRGEEKPATGKTGLHFPHVLTATFYPLLAAFLLLFPQFVEGQCYTLLCNQNVEVKLDDNCQGSVNPYFIIANYWSCQGPMTMTYFNSSGVNIGGTLNSTHIGQTLSVKVKHNWTGLICWGSVVVKDKKAPAITIQNKTLHCTDDPSVEAQGSPAVADNCSGQISLSHQDTVIDFGCGYTGFAGYFAPSNWMVGLTNNGDGGVDVTGAPNSVLVEGARNSPYSVAPRYITRFKIVIPTEGFVSFDWSSFGGSSFNIDALYLTINNWCVQLSYDTIQSGSYTTGLLKPGDVLSFEQASDGNADAVNSLISNFHFNTLAWKVIHRKWKATDEYGNARTVTQVITLNRASLSQVVFPSHRDGISAPSLPCGAMADLAQTGIPFIDEDGNLATTSDQYPVDNGDCFFSLTYQDEVLQECEGSGAVLRKWIVLDDCSNSIKEHTQIIRLSDVTPPAITCPEPVSVSTNSSGCFGEVNLAAATATDDCSSNITITPNWQFGVGYGPFNNVAAGTYGVTYKATDACGNISQCTTQVTVKDEIAPTVICDQITVVAVTTNGSSSLLAPSVDDGSYDWCCLDGFDIKRKNEPNSAFSPTLQFDCDDAGQTIMVSLRATDCAGNANFCDVEVFVEDNIPPIITAPADLTVDCDANLDDLSQFGEATASDNCSATLTYSVSQILAGCGGGTITRSWQATDPVGNTVFAEQKIHLANLTPWNMNSNHIAWPPDYAVSGCGGSTEPFDLPIPFNGPIISGQVGCEAVNVNYEDEVFDFGGSSCYKIKRTWKVTDICQYQPNVNNSPGVWAYEQIIEIDDTEIPIFVNAPSILYFNTTANNCTASFTLPSPQVEDCSDHVIVTVSGQLGSGFSFQNVQAGTYQMTYTASDGCGNSAQHPFTVTVVDNTPPVASCAPEVNMSYAANGQVTLTAQSFNQNSSDNCTPSANLQFSFSQNTIVTNQTYTCGTPDQITVKLWVTDGNGNQSSCHSALVLDDPMNICTQPSQGIAIAGAIKTPGNLPVGNVTVLLGGAVTHPEITQAGVGTYRFRNLPPGTDFIVTPVKDLVPLNGVTSFDLVKIYDHILGIAPFTQPWQHIAGDANSSGMVTTADLVAIQSLILFNVSVFPNNTPSWRFARTDYNFPNPAQPFPFPQFISMNNLTQDKLDAHFTGIKTGDVNGSVNPAMFAPGDVLENRSAGDFIVNAEDRDLSPGEETEVVFTGNRKDLTAWQFTLGFDTRVLEIVSSQPSATNALNEPLWGISQLENGLLAALWFTKNRAEKQQEQRFSLKLKAKAAVKLSEALTINSHLTPALAYNQNEEIMEVKLAFNKPLAQSLVLFQNRPNPFNSETVVSFQIPEAGTVKFVFFDGSGRVLFTEQDEYSEGYHEKRLRREIFASTGLVYYRLETESGTSIGRMMVL